MFAEAPDSLKNFTPHVCRKVRLRLGWNLVELSHESGCSIEVVREFSQRSGEVSLEHRLMMHEAMQRGVLKQLGWFATTLGCNFEAAPKPVDVDRLVAAIGAAVTRVVIDETTAR